MEKQGNHILIYWKSILGIAVALFILLLVYLLSPYMEPVNDAAVITPLIQNRETITVNLNTATAEELMELPGIGSALAQRILAYREANGGFRYVYEITDIEGIGIVTYEKLRDFLSVES